MEVGAVLGDRASTETCGASASAARGLVEIEAMLLHHPFYTTLCGGVFLWTTKYKSTPVSRCASPLVADLDRVLFGGAGEYGFKAGEHGAGFGLVEEGGYQRLFRKNSKRAQS
jgi:hypothetical protein